MMFAYCWSINAQKFIRRKYTIDCGEQKQKYSNAIEKQSIKSTAMNGAGYLGIRRDTSVKHLVSI